jgi:hypothetical protein
VAVRAWLAHDTGLVAVLPRFRRLPGRVRHHRGAGAAWPAEVVLDVTGGELAVVDVAGTPVGRWPTGAVSARVVGTGPPVQFVLDLGDDGSHLLSAAAGPDVDALLTVLAAEPSGLG